MSDARWRLRLFGAPRLEGPEGEAGLRTQRQYGILLYAALEGPRVRRDALVPLFWPGTPDRRGRHSLTQALSELRRALPQVVENDNTHVTLRGVTTDLDHLGTDPACVDRGEVLEGLERLGGIELAQWLDAARERIRRTASRTLESVMAAPSGGNGRLRVAESALRLDPAAASAVLALAEEDLDAGQVTAAVRRLTQYQQHVTEELGFDPDPRVARLLRRLQQGDLERARQAILGDPMRLGATDDKLVGRDAEVAVLADAWRDVGSGRPRTIRLSGGAGIGKSALLRSFFASLAGRGARAFLVTCHQATRAVPFALVADLSDALSNDPGFAAADPRWLAELSRIHPALRNQFPGVPVPESAPPESIRERLTESLTAILDTIAEGSPVALGIDDADQADQASLSVIHLVRRRVRSHAILTVLATSEPDSPIAESGLQADRHLQLQPLSRPAVLALLGDRAASVPERQAVLERVADIAAGNPLYALTLIGDQHLHASVSQFGLYTSTWTPPRDLLDAISRAVVQHSTLARRVLSVLATAGTPASTAAVAEVAGIPESDVRVAVVELLAHDRVRVSGSELRLTSPLWQSAIYAMEPEGVRSFLHQCWAKALLEDRSIPDHTRLPAVARHEARAGLVSEAIAHLKTAARNALDNGAPLEARRSLETGQSLCSTTDVEILSLLAETHAADGRYSDVVQILDQIAQASPVTSDRDLLLRAEAKHRFGQGPVSELRADIQQLGQSPLLESERLRSLQLQAEIGRASGDQGLLADTLASIEQLRPTTPAGAARAALTRGFVLWHQGYFRTSYHILWSAHVALRSLRLSHESARAANGAGIAAMASGNWDNAFRAFAAGLAIARENDDLLVAGSVLTNAGLAAEDWGHLIAARELNQLARRVTADIGATRAQVIVEMNDIDVLLLSGEPDAAQRLLDSVSDLASRTRDDAWTQFLLRKPDIYFALGEVSKAIDAVAALRTWLNGRVVDAFLRSRVLRQTAMAELATGERVTRWDPWPRGGWTRFARVEASLVQACCSHAEGRPGDHLERALSLALKEDLCGPVRWLRVTGTLASLTRPLSAATQMLLEACAKHLDREEPVVLRDFLESSRRGA